MRRQNQKFVKQQAQVVVGEAPESSDEYTDDEYEDIPDEKNNVQASATAELRLDEYVDIEDSGSFNVMKQSSQESVNNKSMIEELNQHEQESASSVKRMSHNNSGGGASNNNNTNCENGANAGRLQLSSSGGAGSGNSSSVNTTAATALNQSVILSNQTSITVSATHQEDNNAQMLESVNNLVCAPYVLYEKDIQKITRHMVATQKLIQASCQTIQKLTAETDQLNRAFETLTLDIFQSINHSVLDSLLRLFI